MSREKTFMLESVVMMERFHSTTCRDAVMQFRDDIWRSMKNGKVLLTKTLVPVQVWAPSSFQGAKMLVTCTLN